MKSVILDTNVVLSFVTDRDARQQELAARLFERAAAGEIRLLLPQIVLVELVYVLRNVYQAEDDLIAGILEDLLALPHLAETNEVEWPAVLKVWPKRIADFADAVLTCVARSERSAVASFDKAFGRRLKELGVAAYWR